MILIVIFILTSLPAMSEMTLKEMQEQVDAAVAAPSAMMSSAALSGGGAMAMMGSVPEQGWGFIPPPGVWIVNTPAFPVRSIWFVHPRRSAMLGAGSEQFIYLDFNDSGTWLASNSQTVGLFWRVRFQYSHSDARAPGQTDPQGIRHYYNVIDADIATGLSGFPPPIPNLPETSGQDIVVMWDDGAYRLERELFFDFEDPGQPNGFDFFQIYGLHDQINGVPQNSPNVPIELPEPGLASSLLLGTLGLVAARKRRA